MMSAIHGNRTYPRARGRAPRMGGRSRRPLRACAFGRWRWRRRATAWSRSPSRARPRARRSSGSQLKSPPANPPAGFSVQSPPRIALDFLDTANGMGVTQREIAEPALRSLNVIQAGNRTRVVFNLNKPQTFETQVEGNAVLVTLTDQAAPSAQAAQVQRFAEAKAADTVARAARRRFPARHSGEGRIIVDLSDNSAGIDIRQQGSNLIVDFLKTSLPRNLERRLDVNDFGTPVVTIDTFPQGSNTRMVIEPQGAVGALGLPDRQPVHPRDQARPRGSQQAHAGDQAAATRARSCRSTSRTWKCARCCRSSPTSPASTSSPATRCRAA